MTNLSALTDQLSVGAYPARSAAALPGDEVAVLARLGCAATRATACVIGWQADGATGVVDAPSGVPHSQALRGVASSLLANLLRDGERDSPSIFHWGSPELVTRLGLPAPGLELAAVAGARPVAAIAAVLTAPAAREVDATLQLLFRATTETIAARRAACSRDFWRQHAQALGAELAGVRREFAAVQAEHRRFDQAVEEAASLQPRDLSAVLGSLIAASGPFDAWLVALRDGGELKIEAWSAGLRIGAALRLDRRSALADSIKRGAPISRNIAAASGGACSEDRIFARAGLAAYFCIPFERGAIALGARAALAPAAAASAQALLKRLAPMLELAVMRREADARRAMTQSLALRLYEAVDAERARIARDLHDDQAQLLAAARIALEAPREKSRRLFSELERRMRLKIRRLRAATFEGASLESALQAQARRLADAGIKARLAGLRDLRELARPLQSVCCQVTREAVSNVIRHSRARNVEICLQRRADGACFSIIDDGRGFGRRVGNRGLGLRGIAERLALIGGNLRVESRPGRSSVIAELPVPPP